MSFSFKLIQWFNNNKRQLPWRETSDPYYIWLSEIILQQTRVDQGMPYYYKFIENFPAIEKLAKAKESEVLKLWQGLGYYSRARNMLFTAKQIVNIYKGKFPDNEEQLLKLKGIGDYTAAAILSFAYNKPFPVVDGNVIRVVSRLYGITGDVKKTDVRKEILLILSGLISKKEPCSFNQAIMEFGAILCKPKNPDCEICPFNKDCYAYANKMVNVLPFKSKNIKIKSRFFNYLIINVAKKNNTFIYFRKRTENDIWKGLYDFPFIETQALIEYDKLVLTEEWKLIFDKTKAIFNSVSEVFKHQLTHQTIYARFFEVTVKMPLKEIKKDVILIDTDRLNEYPIPRLVEKYLQSQNYFNFTA